MERAAPRWIYEVGWFAGQCGERTSPARYAGEGRHECCRVRVHRGVEHIDGRSLFDQSAGVHHGDVVRHLGDHRNVMADVYDGHLVFLLDGPEFPQNAVLDDHVQGGRGFIGDDHVWIAGKGHGYDGSLAHTAAELVGIPFHHSGVQANLAKQFADLVPCLLRGGCHIVGLDGLLYLSTDPVDRIQDVHGRLKHHGNALPAKAAQLLVG